MTYGQALNLLDMRREGGEIPLSLVNQALELTGDLPQDQVQKMIDELDKDSDK